MKLVKISASVIAASLSFGFMSQASARADFPTYHDETRGYVGVQWITGETSLTKPNLVVGLRQTRTEADDIVTGSDVTLTYSLEKGRFDALRAGYLNGKCDVLGTIGLGYSFSKETVLGFAGAVGPYTKLFGELDGNKNPALGIELNTQGCAGKVAAAPV